MAQHRNLTPGYAVVFPNREKASSKLMKAIVALILLASVGLLLIVTIGGWSQLEGMKPINFFWCVAYVIIAFYIWGRWARGMLPIAAGLAILLLMIAVVAGLGLSGTSWFDRSHAGFAPAQSLFGGKGLSADTLGTITLLLDPRAGAADRVRDAGVRAGLERRAGGPDRRGPQTGLQPTRFVASAPARDGLKPPSDLTVVRRVGLEPTRPEGQCLLRAPRQPIAPPPRSAAV